MILDYLINNLIVIQFCKMLKPPTLYTTRLSVFVVGFSKSTLLIQEYYTKSTHHFQLLATAKVLALIDKHNH